MLRLFIAIEVEAAVRESILHAQQRLQLRIDRVKWVRPENYHITLRFLGPMPEEQLGEIERTMVAAASGVEPFEVEWAELGVFPGGAIWVGAKAPPALAELVRNLGVAGDFHPHLTIGRRKGRFEVELEKEGTFGISKVTEIVLVISRLSEQGAVYSVPFRAALGGGFQTSSGRSAL